MITRPATAILDSRMIDKLAQMRCNRDCCALGLGIVCSLTAIVLSFGRKVASLDSNHTGRTFTIQT
jgi:hypothetical protein